MFFKIKYINMKLYGAPFKNQPGEGNNNMDRNLILHYFPALMHFLLNSKFFDINLVVLKAILVVASSTWNNAHKCKWQNTKFTCFVFFLFYKKFINQAIQKSLSLSFHDFAHTQLLSNSMSLFSIFLQRFNWMVF